MIRLRNYRYLILLWSITCFSIISSYSYAETKINNFTIANQFYKISVDSGKNTFSVITVPDGKVLIPQGSFESPIVHSGQTSANTPVRIEEQSITVWSATGIKTQFVLYPDSPFITIRHAIHNNDTNPLIIKSIHPLNFNVNLDKPAGELRSLGTAGLKNIDKNSNPGSYSFLAIADPESRRGIVSGWLTQEKGSGLVFSDMQDGKMLITPQLDFGHLQIDPDNEIALDTFITGYFDDARLGLEQYADAIAAQYKIQLPPQPQVYCTWYHAGASDEKQLLKNAEFAKKNLVPYGFSVMQIDDGWQEGVKKNGPAKNFNTHNAKGPYLSGMKATADAMKKLGLTPGIWFMPFAGSWDDPFYADKQDFFATKDGKPFEVMWGGSCFDLTNPKTQDYIRAEVQRIAKDWGYTYFKMDGLWTGMAADINYVNTGFKDDRLGETLLHDPTKTHIEAYRNGFKLVREAAGKDVFFLGCCVAQNMRTLGASFGLVDAMRIGPDNGRSWEDMCRGPFSGSNLYFLNKRVWYNDPDPIYVEDSVPLDHARALTSWVALTGQLNAASTDFEKLSKERLALLQRSMPAHNLKPRPADLFEETIPRIWLLSDTGKPVRRDVVGLFNWNDKQSADIAYSIKKIGLPAAEYVGFDYWQNEFVASVTNTMQFTLSPASCKILSLRPKSDMPCLLGTSRHITQGIIDVLQESWSIKQMALSGTSQIVGGDPYEIRIAAMKGNGFHKVSAVSVSEEDQSAGVTIKLLSQDGWKVRVVITSPQSRDVRWSVSFRY